MKKKHILLNLLITQALVQSKFNFKGWTRKSIVDYERPLLVYHKAWHPIISLLKFTRQSMETNAEYLFRCLK